MKNKIPEECSKPVELFSADFGRNLSICVLKSYEVLFQPWVELPIVRPLCLRMNPCISSLLDEWQNGKKKKKGVDNRGEEQQTLMLGRASLPPTIRVRDRMSWCSSAEFLHTGKESLAAQQSWEQMSSHISTCISRVCVHSSVHRLRTDIWGNQFPYYANSRRVSDRYLPLKIIVKRKTT